jgi:Transposase DDE domain
MLTPPTVYPALLRWVQALGVTRSAVTAQALAARLTALLCGQSLAPASLMRMLPSLTIVRARAGYARVARTWHGPWLTSIWLTPLLVRAALALARPQETPVLVLDTVRCGRWELLTVGLVWHRRVLLVGWAVLPYPWPKGRFTPTVTALLRQVDAAWPDTAAVPHLLADRGFPSRPFFQTLHDLHWGYTVRLSAGCRVTLNGAVVRVGDLYGAVPERWRRERVQYGSAGRGPQLRLLIGQGVLVVPPHQRDAGSVRARRHRGERRRHALQQKHPGHDAHAMVAVDAWVALLSTDTTVLAALRHYRLRWAIEGSYRDAQSGWDGRHGWDLEPTLAQQTHAEVVERIAGLWALGLLVQSWVGDQVGQPTAPVTVQRVVRRWTVHGRLSVFARGRFAFLDRSGALDAWLTETLAAGAARLAATRPGAVLPTAA